MTEDERKDEEQAEEAATVLSAREAMSLIAPAAPGPGSMADLDSLQSVDAAASESREESASSEDRHDAVESHDTASSET